MKNLPGNAGNTRDADSILGGEYSPGVENGNQPQYSFFFFFLFNPYLFFPFIFIGWRPITLQKYTSNYCSSIPKNKWPNQKMGQITKQTFLQRRHTDGQQTHEKMLNITHYQRNANQSHNEVPPQYSCLENPMDRGAW